MTNDEIRDLLLRFLHERHRKSRGIKGQEIGIRDLQKEMKQRHGLSQPEVAANLDYLVDRGWVKKLVASRSFTTRSGTTQAAERVTYKISATGIDRIEGESEFKRPDPYAGIHIENVGGVTVVGDGNVVRTQFKPAAEALGELRRAVNASELPDQQKFAISTEIQSIELELAKMNPDRTVIQRAWSAIQTTATLGTLLDLLNRAGAALAPLLGGPTSR